MCFLSTTFPNALAHPPPPLYFLTSPLSLLLSLVPSDAVPSLLVYSLQIASRTPALFLVSLGTNIFSTPTQAQFPGNLRPILAFSYLSCLLPGALQLCLRGTTRLLSVKELRPSAVAMLQVWFYRAESPGIIIC